jgi:hypothetical protein
MMRKGTSTAPHAQAQVVNRLPTDIVRPTLRGSCSSKNYPKREGRNLEQLQGYVTKVDGDSPSIKFISKLRCQESFKTLLLEASILHCACSESPTFRNPSEPQHLFYRRHHCPQWHLKHRVRCSTRRIWSVTTPPVIDRLC